MPALTRLCQDAGGSVLRRWRVTGSGEFPGSRCLPWSGARRPREVRPGSRGAAHASRRQGPQGVVRCAITPTVQAMPACFAGRRLPGARPAKCSAGGIAFQALRVGACTVTSTVAEGAPTPNRAGSRLVCFRVTRLRRASLTLPRFTDRQSWRRCGRRRDRGEDGWRWVSVVDGNSLRSSRRYPHEPGLAWRREPDRFSRLVGCCRSICGMLTKSWTGECRQSEALRSVERRERCAPNPSPRLGCPSGD